MEDVKLLIEDVADINTLQKGDTRLGKKLIIPLIGAVYYWKLTVIKYLIEKGQTQTWGRKFVF